MGSTRLTAMVKNESRCLSLLDCLLCPIFFVGCILWSIIFLTLGWWTKHENISTRKTWQHLIAMPEWDVDGTSSNVVVRYAGCAGQRCKVRPCYWSWDTTKSNWKGWVRPLMINLWTRLWVTNSDKSGGIWRLYLSVGSSSSTLIPSQLQWGKHKKAKAKVPREHHRAQAQAKFHKLNKKEETRIDDVAKFTARQMNKPQSKSKQ